MLAPVWSPVAGAPRLGAINALDVPISAVPLVGRMWHKEGETGDQKRSDVRRGETSDRRFFLFRQQFLGVFPRSVSCGPTWTRSTDLILISDARLMLSRACDLGICVCSWEVLHSCFTYLGASPAIL